MEEEKNEDDSPSSKPVEDFFKIYNQNTSNSKIILESGSASTRKEGLYK